MTESMVGSKRSHCLVQIMAEQKHDLPEQNIFRTNCTMLRRQDQIEFCIAASFWIKHLQIS